MANKISKSAENYYNRYKTGNIFATNRKKKLTRLLKLQPNNKQVEKALSDLRSIRQTPRNPEWSSSKRQTAILMKLFTGKFDKNIYSTDNDLQAAALKARNPNKFTKIKFPETKYKSPFCLGNRAHDGRGNTPWAV
jgi:hypothetical protein